ncbi:hypothetical protein ACWDD9_31570 [Kitasatospora sp. NPDC001119]|uniref:hypothetical protein n=1 Tax=unclassified Kitasatospora TaxID=2633591 RepID=UPI0036961573
MSSPTQSPTPPPAPEPFLTVRTAVILLAGALTGLVVGGLTFLGGGRAATAAVAGLAAFGASVVGLHKLIA